MLPPCIYPRYVLCTLAVWVSLLGWGWSEEVPEPGGPLRYATAPEGYFGDFVRMAGIPWPENETLHVVCHGHSVPAGFFNTPDVRTFEAYPHLLHVGLKDRFPFAVMNVIVTAVGGENSREGAERFERDVLRFRPDVVTIDYGLNDRRIGLEAAREAWVSMIEGALKEGVKVVLLTPTYDVRVDLSDPADPLNQHAAQVRELAAHYQVALVDSLAAFAEAGASGTELDDLMAQGNHPNGEGHELVARGLLSLFPVPESGGR